MSTKQITANTSYSGALVLVFWKHESKSMKHCL